MSGMDSRTSQVHELRESCSRSCVLESGIVDLVIRDGNLLISNWTSPKRECVISKLPLNAKP